MFIFRTLYVDSVPFIKIIIFQTENEKPAKNLWVPMWNRFVCAYFTTNPPPPFLYKFSSFIEVENCTTFVKGDSDFNFWFLLFQFNHRKNFCHKVYYAMPIKNLGFGAIFFFLHASKMNLIGFDSYLLIIWIRGRKCWRWSDLGEKNICWFKCFYTIF